MTTTITSEQLRSAADRADKIHTRMPAGYAASGPRRLSFTYADGAAIARLAAQLKDDDVAGDIELASWPEAQTLVALAARLFTRA